MSTKVAVREKGSKRGRCRDGSASPVCVCV